MKVTNNDSLLLLSALSLGTIIFSADQEIMDFVQNTKSEKTQQVGLFAVSTGLATQLVTEIFKKSFLRVCPNKIESPYQFGEEGSYSFFSGHTPAAFSLATVIAEVYKDQPIVPYLSYVRRIDCDTYDGFFLRPFLFPMISISLSVKTECVEGE